MTHSPFKTRGSLLKLQRDVAKFYSLLQQRFEGNSLISDTWASMERDLQAQAESLKKLPSTFWKSMKKQEKDLEQAMRGALPCEGSDHAGTLPACLSHMLNLEEPLVMKVYAPLIKRLRVDWTECALDFYVLVKAHIARLERLVLAYSGDPALGQRCTGLFQSFEKEVQEQVVIEAHPPRTPGRQAVQKTPQRKVSQARRTTGLPRKRPRRALENRAERAKPLVKKLEITRRRARR